MAKKMIEMKKPKHDKCCTLCTKNLLGVVVFSENKKENTIILCADCIDKIQKLLQCLSIIDIEESIYM
jgi:hypothetical protein